MSHWIADWKREIDAQREDERLKEKLRLHKSEMIRAKLPSFWESIVQCVTEDAAQLKSAFPADEAFHCVVTREAQPANRPLIVQKATHPFRRVELRLNLEGQRIEIAKGTLSDIMGNIENPMCENIDACLAKDETLSFNRDGVEIYRTPSEFSKHMFEFLCDRTSKKPSRAFRLDEP